MRLYVILLCLLVGYYTISYVLTDKSVRVEKNDGSSATPDNVNSTNDDDPCHCGGHCLCRPYPDCRRIICW